MSVRAQRLQQEMRALAKAPIKDGVWLRPEPNDLGRWHFVLTGAAGTDYEGGVYHGLLTLPDEYPFDAPDVYMFTPSGRFEVNTPICTTFTSFHSKQWNPTWSLSGLVLGFESFMLESLTHKDEHRGNVGSYYAQDYTAEQRRQMARESLGFNARNPVFRDLFPEVAARAEVRDVTATLTKTMLAAYDRAPTTMHALGAALTVLGDDLSLAVRMMDRRRAATLPPTSEMTDTVDAARAPAVMPVSAPAPIPAPVAPVAPVDEGDAEPTRRYPLRDRKRPRA